MSRARRIVGALGARPWLVALGELALIVVGILLALAIDQWGQEQAEVAAELESLELLSRDINQVMVQLDEYIDVVDNTATSAARVFNALSGPRDEIDQVATSDDMLGLILRRTMRLPRAAYTDLLNTGNLRLIRDRELRDAVVRFYESVERSEAIFQRNTDVFVDGMATPLLVGQGLMLPRPVAPSEYTYSLVNEAFEEAVLKLGRDRVYSADPFWSLSPDSREWDQLRAVSLMLARNASLNKVLAVRLSREAASLQERLSEAVDARSAS